MINFRKEILKQLKQQGITGYRLAKEAGLPIRGVQMFLVGDRDITSERLALLLDVLGYELKSPRKRRRK